MGVFGILHISQLVWHHCKNYMGVIVKSEDMLTLLPFLSLYRKNVIKINISEIVHFVRKPLRFIGALIISILRKNIDQTLIK